MVKGLRFLSYIIFMMFSCTVSIAQEVVHDINSCVVDENEDIKLKSFDNGNQVIVCNDSVLSVDNSFDNIVRREYDTLNSDTLPGLLYPYSSCWGYPVIAHYPGSLFGGTFCWDLHKGFNASIDMSVMAGFGKRRIPGVGFGTGISFMYADQLTDKLVYSVGGYYSHLSWNELNYNDFGVSLMAGYKINDNVSLYAYGSKSFSPLLYGKNNPCRMVAFPYMNGIGDRIGAMLHLKLSETVSVSLSVEERIHHY